MYPGRDGQTEVNSDQTIFVRTHVRIALELYGLEKTSSALCLDNGHYDVKVYPKISVLVKIAQKLVTQNEQNLETGLIAVFSKVNPPFLRKN